MVINPQNIQISVVVPVYNVQKCLDRCISSITHQSYQNLQIILVDDGSNDCSGIICEEWAKRDSRIEVLHRENGGLSAARNTGMNAVKGDNVVFVDSDDAIGTNHISNLLNAVVSADAETVVAVTGFTNTQGSCSLDSKLVTSSSFATLTPEEAVIASVTIGERFAAHAWGKMYPKKMYPLLNFPIGKYYEDQFVTYKTFLEADSVVYEDADDYFYTSNRNDSISNGSRIRQLDYLEGIRETLQSVKAICPGAVGAVYLRYLISLAGCLKIFASEGERRIYDTLFIEAVNNRKNALTASSLGIKTRSQFLATYLGNYLCRALFRIHDKIKYEICKDFKQ